ncbi:unnamed protein product, partial [Sphacelaria rigidula]
SPLICTIGVCCGHTKATIQCYSCSRFKGGRGFYCAECFEARHPWYRAAHSWVKLGDSPDSENELETQIHRTDLEREVADTRGMLQAISLWQREIKFQHADTKGDDLIKEATRHATRVATKIRYAQGESILFRLEVIPKS